MKLGFKILLSLVFIMIIFFTFMVGFTLGSFNVNSDDSLFSAEYANGCMEMLAIEYNFTYPIEDKTLRNTMQDKYRQCMNVWIEKRWSTE